MGITDLANASASFAQELESTLQAVLPARKQIVSIAFGSRFVVRPEGDHAGKQRIPLLVGGEHLADLGVQLYFGLDKSGQYLKTVRSKVGVHSVLDRTPLFRQEFDSDLTNAPVAHWHIHADRGSLSHLLSRAHAIRPIVVNKPHDMSSLHFPVGGERFRPCLEDVLEFLIRECGVDANAGWEAAIASGRERWRRFQFKSSVRDLQHEAAEVLRTLGWTVERSSVETTESAKTLTRW